MRLLSFSASRLCGEAQHKRCFFDDGKAAAKLKDT